MIHIIFILPNIYDHVSGVSTKYISFIQHLSQNPAFKITLLHTSHKRPHGITLHPTSSLPIPFYPSLTVPYFTSSHLKRVIEKSMKNIIIFHSEFIWLHSILLGIKDEFQEEIIQLIPNMHTDIDEYVKKYVAKVPLLSGLASGFELGKYIDQRLIDKKFDGIIVTGSVLFQKYVALSGCRVVNVNEIDTSTFVKDGYKAPEKRRDVIWKSGAFVNVICCCRLSVEKNVEMVFDLCDDLVRLYLSGDYSKVRIHIVGDGPHRGVLEKYAEQKYGSGRGTVTFYGAKDHLWIANFYQKIYNPIFLFCSTSETFGKTSVEALCSGIIVFQIECAVSREIFLDGKNGFLFHGRSGFIQRFDTYMKMKYDEVAKMGAEMRLLAQKYDQKKIFREWRDFLLSL